jgi:beta-1,4-mannosyltransferase
MSINSELLGSREYSARFADQARARRFEVERGRLAVIAQIAIERHLTIWQRHPKIRPEPRRDWTIGPISGHRLNVIVTWLGCTLLLYLLQNFVWPQGLVPKTTMETVFSWGSLLWLSAIIPGFCALTGMIVFKHSNKLDQVRPIRRLVSWRIVSRGTNVEILTETIRRCQREMAKTPLFPFVIEVVTDHQTIDLARPADDVISIAVPKDFRTPNNSHFKARALHYASTHSVLPDDAWIVHLDEETQPTSSGIKGICSLIREEEATGRYRIGQGAILYHRRLKQFPFLTLADNIRTGDDFGRFHLGHRLGITLYGMHGSFIVVRNDLEKSIGFDVGPHGSITEDSFWALMAMERGHRCRWVDGYLEEQSTQSVSDFIKQRRRWFQGLAKVAVHAPVALKWRFTIGLNSILWALAPFSLLYSFLHLFYGTEVQPLVRFLANTSLAAYATIYLVGLKANLDEHGIYNRFARLFWYLLQCLLLPFCCLLESLGVVWAICKPAEGFHVVKK